MDVIRVRQANLEVASKLLARALVNDAASGYHFPDEGKRPAGLEWFHRWLVRIGLKQGVVYATSPELAGLAIWMPPGSEKISFGAKVAAGLLGAPLSIGIGATARILRSMSALEGVHARAVPGKHWYLVIVGVDPDHQGKGVGSVLMRHALAKADKDGLPCYLETTSKASRKTFQQFGFEVVGDAVGVRGLPTWAMVRPPQVREPSVP